MLTWGLIFCQFSPSAGTATTSCHAKRKQVARTSKASCLTQPCSLPLPLPYAAAKQEESQTPASLVLHIPHHIRQLHSMVPTIANVRPHSHPLKGSTRGQGNQPLRLQTPYLSIPWPTAMHGSSKLHNAPPTNLNVSLPNAKP